MRYLSIVVLPLMLLSSGTAQAEKVIDAPLPNETGTDAAATSEIAAVTFEEHIRPILRTHCFDCHGSRGEKKGGLDLRLKRLMETGGESGAGIVPGKPDESLLLERITAGEMPPTEIKLKPEEIELFKRWIAEGAKTAREEPAEIGDEVPITPEDRAYWAFQPIKRPAVPESTPDERVRTGVDAMLLKQLREKGLTLSSDAPKLTLLKRATMDLTGLPPRPEEIVRFLADDRPDAWEHLLDRLLASKHYGERWGRHWLDVAGYADSEGANDQDVPRPNAYRYRDYVIKSFNDDKPLDQFIIEQLAGDELVTPPYANLADDQIEKLVATGFLRMAADGSTGGGDQNIVRNQVVADTIKIVSTSLLGMSVGCAQCHDHRYDPITQTDYYRMRALFEPAYDWKNWKVPSQRQVSLMTDEERQQSQAIEAEAAVIVTSRNEKQAEFIKAALEVELMKFDESLRDTLRTAFETPDDKRTDEQKMLFSKNPSLNINGGNLYQYNAMAAEELKKLDAQIGEIRAKKPKEEFIRVLMETPGSVPVTHLFHRGEHEQPKEAVAPGGLTVTAPEGARFAAPENVPELPSTGRRLAYARWLTNGQHPLLARVLANRFWLHHFGRGIVNSPGEFGRLGDEPTHPELLDWLASELMENGWSLKKLHRHIMTSTVYRQSSFSDPEKNTLDPSNMTYWRMPVIRLDAEVIRDKIMATSGVLNPALYGEPIPVKEDDVGQIVIGVDSKGPANRPGNEVPIGEAEFRRSVYIQVRRSQPLAMTRAFDAPVMEVNCDRRTSSTAATQALMLMNSKFMLEQAEYFSRRVINLAPADRAEQIRNAWLLAFARPVTEAELNETVEFLTQQAEEFSKKPVAEADKEKTPSPEHRAMTSLCQVLLSSNEFLYVD